MVKVTMDVLSVATFGADPFHAEELNLSDRDIHDLGVVTQLTQLTELNLAFNRLESLQSLSELRGLRALNVSHNNLANLKGLGELTGLEQLNASCNQIKHLGPLARCSSLHTLWLHKNQVQDAMQLRELGAALPELTHLWLGGNPVCKLSSRVAYRASVLGAFENLRALDSRAITNEDHDAAIGGGEEPLMMMIPRSNHDRPEGDYAQETTAQRSALGSAAPPKFGRRSSRSGSRKHPSPKKSDIPDDFSISQVAGLLPDLGLAPKEPPKPSLSQRKSQKAKPVGSPAKQGRRSRPPSGGPAPWDEEEDPNLAAAKQMLKALGQQQQPENGRRSKPQSSNGQDFHGAGGEEDEDEDPTLAMAKRMLMALGEQGDHQQQPVKEEEKAAGAPKRSSSSSSNGSSMNSGSYEATYAKGGGSAVVVHEDGSVRVSWPNGEVALMCQTEQHAQRPSYRLQVHYRVSGALAAAFDPDGSGFVQYPDGRMMLMYRSDGEGTVYAPDGSVTRQWHDSGRGGLELLAAGGTVQAQLDQFLGVRLAPGGDSPAGEGKPQLEVFFACEGVKHRVVHGRNPTRKSWGSDGGPQPPFLDALGRGPQRRKKEPPPPRDTRPVDARMEDVAGVANAMNDLEKDLSSWLTRLKPT